MSEFHEEEEEYFCRFTFGQFVSVALLELVALFFVFYLGARYGTGLLGNKAPETREELSGITADERLEPSQADAAEVKYTFQETLTRKDDEDRSDLAAKTALGKKARAPTPTRPVDSNPQPHKVLDEVRSRKGYSIQVGSYRQASGAASKVSQWQAKGYDAFLSIGSVPNSGTWYRVRIGSFKSRDSARKFLEQLSKREKIQAIIVRSSS